MTPATGGRSRCARSRFPRTIVFDAPRHARGFFEALVADNLDIGRPHNVEIIFGRRVRRDTWGTFRTAIDRRDNGGVLVNVFYKHSRIKQYLKDGRAMRIETVVNAPRDLGCNARLPNLGELQAKARAANRRILDAERAGQGTVLASPAFERIAHPSIDAEGRRTPAPTLRRSSGHGPGRACARRCSPRPASPNKNLRVLIAGLLGSAYTPGQMTYDLRLPSPQRPASALLPPHTNRYVLTARWASAYRRLLHQDLQPAPRSRSPPRTSPRHRRELRAGAGRAITRHVNDYA